MYIHWTITDYQCAEILSALKKRAQYLRGSTSTRRGESDCRIKLICIEGLIAELNYLREHTRERDA
jgi:hypothetical protein